MVSKLEMERLDRASISDRRSCCITLWTQLQVCPSTMPVSSQSLQVKCGSSASAGRPLEASRSASFLRASVRGRSGIGAVLARRTGQCAADAPHPHLFFGVAQPGDSGLGLSAGVLRLGPCGLTTAGDGAQGFLIQFVFGTHSVSLCRGSLGLFLEGRRRAAFLRKSLPLGVSRSTRMFRLAPAAATGVRTSWILRRPLAFQVLRMLFQYHRSRFGPACTAASCTMASS